MGARAARGGVPRGDRGPWDRARSAGTTGSRRGHGRERESPHLRDARGARPRADPPSSRCGDRLASGLNACIFRAGFGGSSNGRTTGSGPVNLGSNPSPPTSSQGYAVVNTPRDPAVVASDDTHPPGSARPTAIVEGTSKPDPTPSESGLLLADPT